MSNTSGFEQVDTLRQGRPPEEFPSHTFPTIYADLAFSLTFTAEVVKFYLARVDPNLFGRGGAAGNPFIQVAMPKSGFLATAIFFQQQLERMVEQGLITHQEMDDAKKQFATPATSSPTTTEKQGE